MGKGVPRTGDDRMSRLLVEIRGSRSQAEVARLTTPLLTQGLPLSQSKISRAEAGQYPLSPRQAEALARACSATAEQRDELVRLAHDYAAGAVRSRAALQRNAVTIQRRIARLEDESGLIRGWQDSLVLGVAQIPAYRAAVVGSDPGRDWTEAREQRRRQLRDGGREWRLLMYEGALRWALSSYGVMAEQMRHLAEVSTWPGVTLGIVDQHGVKPTPAPAGAFHLYGHRMALSATDAGTTFLSDPGDVRMYEGQFAALEGVAVTGDACRGLLADLEREYERRAAASSR